MNGSNLASCLSLKGAALSCQRLQTDCKVSKFYPTRKNITASFFNNFHRIFRTCLISDYQCVSSQRSVVRLTMRLEALLWGMA